ARRSDLFSRALRLRFGRQKNPRGWIARAFRGASRKRRISKMVSQRPEAGMIIDGFLLQEKIHKGGMATLWRVVRVASVQHEQPPLLMKIPILGDNNDPAAIVGFEVEQMIMPKLAGIHVPHFVGSGDFTVQPYIVMELIAGKSLRARFEGAPLP